MYKYLQVLTQAKESKKHGRHRVEVTPTSRKYYFGYEPLAIEFPQQKQFALGYDVTWSEYIKAREQLTQYFLGKGYTQSNEPPEEKPYAHLKPNGQLYKSGVSLDSLHDGYFYAYRSDLQLEDGRKFSVATGHEEIGHEYGYGSQHKWEELLYWCKEFTQKTPPRLYLSEEEPVDLQEIPEELHEIIKWHINRIKSNGEDVGTKGFVRY